jgi:hypothetical protein
MWWFFPAFSEEAKGILDKIAPNVIKSKNAPAGFILTSGIVTAR